MLVAQNDDELKNEDYIKNENDLKVEDDLKNEKYDLFRTVPARGYTTQQHFTQCFIL